MGGSFKRNPKARVRVSHFGLDEFLTPLYFVAPAPITAPIQLHSRALFYRPVCDG